MAWRGNEDRRPRCLVGHLDQRVHVEDEADPAIAEDLRHVPGGDLKDFADGTSMSTTEDYRMKSRRCLRAEVKWPRRRWR